jgi:hypothetical protein
VTERGTEPHTQLHDIANAGGERQGMVEGGESIRQPNRVGMRQREAEAVEEERRAVGRR